MPLLEQGYILIVLKDLFGVEEGAFGVFFGFPGAVPSGLGKAWI